MLQIHERIKNERLKAKLSEEQIAKIIGIERTTYQYWEKKTPSIDKVKLVAKALGLDENYFLVNHDEDFGRENDIRTDELKKANKEDLLIALLNEKEFRRKEADRWAREFFSLIKSNLSELSTHQALLSAQVMTILEREIDKEAKGNLILKKKLMVKVYKQIDENYAGPSEEDN
jgi:transcriptional regulator with XRE-family HTH domain